MLRGRYAAPHFKKQGLFSGRKREVGSRVPSEIQAVRLLFPVCFIIISCCPPSCAATPSRPKDTAVPVRCPRLPSPQHPAAAGAMSSASPSALPLSRQRRGALEKGSFQVIPTNSAPRCRHHHWQCCSWPRPGNRAPQTAAIPAEGPQHLFPSFCDNNK